MNRDTRRCSDISNLDCGAIRQTAAAHGVRFRHYGSTDTVIKTSCRMALDIRGAQDACQSFRNCFHANTCPLLREGRLHASTVAPNVRHFRPSRASMQPIDSIPARRRMDADTARWKKSGRRP